MRKLILIAALVSLPAAGGEIYKCKGPKGEITFTNIRCPAHTETEHYSTYEPEPDPPTIPVDAASPSIGPANSTVSVDQPVSPAVPASVWPPAQPSTSAAQPSAPSESSVAAAASTPASGYKCSDGENVWLQSTPCPQATAQRLSKLGEPSATSAAAPVAGAAAVMPAAATPPATSQGALCDQLIAQTAGAERQKDRAGSDELDKLLAANGCRR